MASKSFIDCISENGVVGAGGAGFPTHIKLNNQADYFIANGVECEPLLQSDKYLMKEKFEELLEGISIIKNELNSKTTILAVKEYFFNSIKTKFKRKTKDGVELKGIEDFYPSGDEHILIYETTGLKVPQGGIPANIKVIVNNISTILAVFNSVNRGLPFNRKIVTVAGEIKKPGIYEIPIGVTYSDIIKNCGGSLTEDFAILDGGPMMGIIKSAEDSITKTTNGIIILPSDHVIVRKASIKESDMNKRAKASCCQCSKCTELCSRYLLGHSIEPHRMMRASYAEEVELHTSLTSSFLCSQCGICTLIACPMMLSPKELYLKAKIRLLDKKIDNPHKNSNFNPRLEREDRKVAVDRMLHHLNLSEYRKELHFKGTIDKISRIHVNLKQHIGATSIPTVKKGDKVVMNQLIAKIPLNALGSNIHTPFSGVVTSVTEKRISIKL